MNNSKIAKYVAIEDNGGGLYLLAWDNDGALVWAHGGYEYARTSALADDIAAIRDGDDTGGWDGNNINCTGISADELDFAAWYADLDNHIGWEIIADADGTYPRRMGVAGRIAFGLTDDSD